MSHKNGRDPRVKGKSKYALKVAKRKRYTPEGFGRVLTIPELRAIKAWPAA